MRDAEAMTIVLTTHYLDEADTIAERVVVVDNGQIIADDTAEALKANLAGDRIVLGAQSEGAATRVAGILSRMPGAREVTAVGTRVEARINDGPGALPVLLREADRAGTPVATAQVHRPTLDDVFLSLTGRSLREADAPNTETTGKAAA